MEERKQGSVDASLHGNTTTNFQGVETLGAMGDVYRVSGSGRVQQMEAELSQQLSALRVEIEENGLQRGAGTSKSYSSVPPPKDIFFFRMEREHALRRELQVAEALPVTSQAEVMQRELESCLSLEYTPESLPLLLHQFYADRSRQLAQIKYLLMLRWRRFCRHTSVIEKLYPHYKDQVSSLMSEYEDAVQRARRLSASREKILTGRGNPADLLTQGDVVIYLRWLVCHLHSVHTIHNFLTVLHYIPACERKDEEEEEARGADGASGRAQRVPLLSAHLEEFLPELQSLITYFHLSYDARRLRTTADEMELFCMVWREFRTIFRQQEQMKTFPQYDSSEVMKSQWGRKSASTALRKEANWIPFIQVKPRRDPWQQKLVTDLKEKQSVDELLRMHCRFLQVSDLLHVAAALKDQGARVGAPRPSPASAAPLSTRREKISQIWAGVYGAAGSTQETHSHSPESRGRGGGDKRSLQGPRSTHDSRSFEDSLQLLSLDDSLEGGASDPVVSRGAYLSLVYLRHLKLRELQRVSLGLLNYLRSVERTLTFDLAGLQLEGGRLRSMAEETGWMNAARGGRGEAEGLGSQQHHHNSPVDYKVHCSEFMEFAEVENLHDFYSAERRLVHTQDQRGLYVVYDAALRDLDELESELLLVGSHFILRDGTGKTGEAAEADVDRGTVLLDLWTCETEFLESKVQLLNCYYEAYQHTAGTEERCALARVITDITHSRPQLDLNQDYFVQTYRAEINCLQSHQQLIKEVLDNQIEKQRLYLQRVWRDDHKGSAQDYGLPLNHVPKHVVSLGGSGPALMSVFLLEVHPSLCLASAVYDGLLRAHTELCQLHRATSVSDKLALQQRLLQQALQGWTSLPPAAASYSPQIQKDLFSDVFFDDPVLVQRVGLSLVNSAEERETMVQGREKQSYAVETFSRLLELVTLRHRLLELASDSAHLAQLYRGLASELGFGEFHLYLRPAQFEVAEPKNQTEQRPVFITATLEDDSSVDRFAPSHLPLGIQELDEIQIGRFSFGSEEAVTHLMNKQSVENLQVTLACQVTHRNALISAVKLACLCYWAQREEALCPDRDVKSATKSDAQLRGDADDLPEKSNVPRTPTSTGKERLTEAFVSIQLEKVGLRDEMLNSFVKRKRALGGHIKTPEEAAKIKRSLIIDFLQKFNARMSQHCVRAQIVAYYHSLSALLGHVPSIRQAHFRTEQASELSGSLLSADGAAVLSLWVVPRCSEVLQVFKQLEESACATALHHTLQIVSALHDIVCYLVTCSRLGDAENSCGWRRSEEAPGSHLVAEDIGAELQELQRQVRLLAAPGSPRCVGRLLQLRRHVLLLQFDAAVRHLARESFLCSGDVASSRSLSDGLAAALAPLGDGAPAPAHALSLTLPVPPPLPPRGCQARRMFAWRSLIACQRWFPLRVWDPPPIEHCVQMCLSGLSRRCRLQVHAALLAEDVLSSGRDARPVRLHGDGSDPLRDGKPEERDETCLEAEAEETHSTPPPPAPPAPPAPGPAPQDPVRVQSVLRGFLLLTKQLQVFKESWARRRLGVEMFSSPGMYQQFVKLYRAEIFQPSMRALAQQLGKERDYEVLLSGSQSLLPPPGASEVDVKVWQLHRLLESAECDMIKAVQRRISADLTLVLAERTRQDTCLPTELWRKSPPRHRVWAERPQMVETFVQQLTEGAEQVEGQLQVSEDHLQRCLTHLGSSVMERERRSFLLYSHFYEQILQQETELLHQREQDLKDLKESQRSSPHKEVSVLCRGMMLEISALQARLAQLEDEKLSLEERVGLRFKERYDPLVRQLFNTCVQLKARLEECPRQMERDVSVMVNRVRREGVDRITKLRKKYGCSEDDEGLALTQSKREEVHELSLENRRLTALLCKLRTLSGWRQVVDQEKLHRRLLQTQQREISSRSEALRVKLQAEEEVVFLQEELSAAREALSRCQAECSRTQRQLGRKTEELQVARRQSAREARGRQERDAERAQSLEQLRVGVEERERQLRALGEQLDRGGRMNQLQRQRSAKELRQVRGQLQQERSLKHEAFHRVEQLKNQVDDMEAAFRCTSTTGISASSVTGQSRLAHRLSVSRLSTASLSAGLHGAGRLGSLTHCATLQDSAAEPRHRRAPTAGSRSSPKTNRAKADLSRLCVLSTETSLPQL